MANLYDRADIYDIFDNEDRYRAYRRHWEIILRGKEISSLLDVSIGSGNVTLPLAELGISLCGSDLSGSMLENCARKAAERGFEIELKHSDFRNLSCWEGRKFDCVASTGNSLPHVENSDVLKTLEQMDSLVGEGGWLYFDIRNWDRILRERNRFYLYNPMLHNDTRINLVQVWDYHDAVMKDASMDALKDASKDVLKDASKDIPDDISDNISMTFNLLYTFEKENKIFQKEIFEEQYYPIKRDKILEKLKELGYKEIELMCFPAFFENVDVDKAEWYCVMAQKGNGLK